MGKKRKAKDDVPGELLVCRNPKADKQYTIEERIEAGMVLVGSEVKSMRDRRADLEGAYAAVTSEELFLHKMHIAPYEQAGPFNHEPKRTRKLLVHKAEIRRIAGRLTMRGYTLVPLRVYFRNGKAKVELGLAKGRKTGDNREELKKKAEMREVRAAASRRRS